MSASAKEDNLGVCVCACVDDKVTLRLCTSFSVQQRARLLSRDRYTAVFYFGVPLFFVMSIAYRTGTRTSVYLECLV